MRFAASQQRNPKADSSVRTAIRPAAAVSQPANCDPREPGNVGYLQPDCHGEDGKKGVVPRKGELKHSVLWVNLLLNLEVILPSLQDEGRISNFVENSCHCIEQELI